MHYYLTEIQKLCCTKQLICKAKKEFDGSLILPRRHKYWHITNLMNHEAMPCSNYRNDVTS